MTPYHPREIQGLLQKALQNMPVVVLTGMRQTGKSTLLQQEPWLKSRRYYSLDDFAALEAAERHPEALVEGEAPVTIDEAQRAPQLLRVIKRLVDRHRHPGQFILSGSANFSLLKQASESLAGRAVYLTLWPMHRREIAGTIQHTPALLQFRNTHRWPSGAPAVPITPAEILRGGMPSACLGDVKDGSVWFQGYEQTYLERDVRALSQVSDLLAFRHLLHLTALRTGNVLNYSELGRDAKLNTTTVMRYLSLFETSYVITRLSPYLKNRASRLIKSPKVYLTDAGLASHLMGFHDADAMEREPLVGALLETYVIHNVLSLVSAHDATAHAYFWNVQGRHEVDVVLEFGQTTLAIEIKWATRWKDHDLAGLRAFLDVTPRCQAGILAYNGTDVVSLGKRLWAVPLAVLLS